MSLFLLFHVCRRWMKQIDPLSVLANGTRRWCLWKLRLVKDLSSVWAFLCGPEGPSITCNPCRWCVLSTRESMQWQCLCLPPQHPTRCISHFHPAPYPECDAYSFHFLGNPACPGLCLQGKVGSCSDRKCGLILTHSMAHAWSGNGSLFF